MTPTLSGRLQTRVFLAITIGTLWTAVITPVLPRPAGMPVSFAYHVTFEALGLMVALGVGWELVYHTIQQARWDKDWPSVAALLVVVPEAIPLWFVTHALDVIPGTVYLSSPITPLYVIHVSTTWVLMWLFMQGPLRVLHIRWRFEGGQVLVRAPGRFRRRAARPGADDVTDLGTSIVPAVLSADPSARNRTDLADGDSAGWSGSAGHGGEQLVDGVTCPDGHFSYLWARYCEVCGAALLPLTSRSEQGRRPPVGILILADGASQVVDADLRVIRSSDEGGLSFSPRDEISPELSVADIRLGGWQPVVSSQHGISLSLPGGSRLRLDSHVPVPLVPGAEFEFAGHCARYESPYQAPGPAMVPESQDIREPALTEPVPTGAASMLASLPMSGVAAVCRPVARCARNVRKLRPRRPRIVAVAVGAMAAIIAATTLSLLHEFGTPDTGARPRGLAVAPVRPRKKIRPPASPSAKPATHSPAGVGVDGVASQARATVPEPPAQPSLHPSPERSPGPSAASPPVPPNTPNPTPTPTGSVSVCPVSVTLPGTSSPVQLPVCLNVPSLLP